MGSTYTPSNLQSGFRSLAALNNEFQKIKDSIDRLLSRKGDSPNQMDISLDMNTNEIINVSAPANNNSAARLQDLLDLTEDIGSTTAVATSISDSNSFYNSTNVEGALEEIGGPPAIAVDSVSDLNTGSFDSTVSRLWLSGFTGVGTPGGGPLYRDSADTTTSDNGGTVFVDSDSVRWKAGPGFVVATNTTINIPTDYSTLQEAIDELSQLSVTQGVVFDLLIETAHQPTAGISVTNGSYNHFQVSSVDAEVTLDPSFTSGEDFIAAIDAVSPVLNCLVDANGLARYGVNCQRGAHITVNGGCGVKNADQRGIYLNENSTASATDTIWTGVGTVVSTGLSRGAWVARGSTLIGENADFSNSEGIGVYVSRASTVHAMDLKAENCTEQAVWVHRSSRLTAHSVTDGGVLLSNKSASTTPTVLVTRSSMLSLNADAGTAPVTITQNGSGNGITCRTSVCDIHTADLVGDTSSENGIDCTAAGTVNANSTTITGFNNGIDSNGGTINAPNLAVTSSRNIGVRTLRGETNIAAGSVTGSTTTDLVNNNGAFTRADGCTTTNGVGSPDIGDTNMGSFNSLDSRGVIFT